MMIGFAGWVAMIGIAIILVASGGLTSSLINRAYLRRISQQIEHNTKNNKMMQELVAKLLKAQGRDPDADS